MGWVVNPTPRPLYPRDWPGAYFMGRWADPRDGLNGRGKISLPMGIDARTVQRVASHYTYWIIPAIYIKYRSRYIQSAATCERDIIEE